MEKKSMRISILKMANAVRVGTDDMVTVTSTGAGFGRFEIEMLEDKLTISIKHLRMGTTTYTTLYNVIYYQRAAETERLIVKSKAEAQKLAATL
jgi:hypothetical protein